MTTSPTFKTYYAESKRESVPLIDTFFSKRNFETIRDDYKSIAQSELEEKSEEDLKQQVIPRFSPTSQLT